MKSGIGWRVQFCLRDEAGNDLLPLRDLDLLTLVQEALDSFEAVAKIADRSFLHVMHRSITLEKRQSVKAEMTMTGSGTRGLKRVCHDLHCNS